MKNGNVEGVSNGKNEEEGLCMECSMMYFFLLWVSSKWNIREIDEQ